MKAFVQSICLTGALIFALGSIAGEMPQYSDGDFGILHGGNLEMSNVASRDTVFLIGPWGSGSAVNGQFQDESGAPAWNGWTSIDLTQETESAWHVDTYKVVSGVYSAWCGEIVYDACTPEDPVGGYGPGYSEFLSWYGTVVNSHEPTAVNIVATVNHNTEPGYDFSNLGYYKNDYSIAYLWTTDGEGELVPIDVFVTYQPGEYVGEDANQVRITWHVTSDGGWDDSDCSYFSDGALQVDDITVTMANGENQTTYFHDFEDGSLGEWIIEFKPGFGDYGHIRSKLKHLDPCAVNYSPVACFIADEIMLAERGLPTRECRTWCYGPGGYIVQTEGGAGRSSRCIHSAIQSPIIPWPQGDYSSASYQFDVYRHEDLSADAPGIFYTWGIRSTASADPADIEQDYFHDRNFVYYGGPDWVRGGESKASDLLVPGLRFVQVEFTVYELCYVWGWDGDDGYPAPYFDNISLKCYNSYGPSISARELDLAQDAFPADGQTHLGADMHLNDVRFDMANNISPASDLRNDPGDSIVVNIVAVRTGSVLVESEIDPLVGAPRLVWILKPGPMVNMDWRTNLDQAGYNELDGNGNLIGEVVGAPAVSAMYNNPDRWMFDLPDSSFLYPGDVLQYFIVAWDDLNGDYQYATLPADRTGFGDFTDQLHYNPSFIVHALPTLADDQGAQPDVLFWNDFGNRGGRDEWHGAFRNLGLVQGADFDIYYTNSPSSSVSNGLGGRAAYGQLDGYQMVLYTCGDLGRGTISNLDYDNDAGDDVGLLSDWLERGEKVLFATGDNLISDLNQPGAATGAFITDWMGLTYEAEDARLLLGGDTAPAVNSIPGNWLFQTTPTWIVYGGCPELNTFDAVSVDQADLLADFNSGGSGLAAAASYRAPNNSVVISMPYDFMNIWTPRNAKADQPAGRPTRVDLLSEVLTLTDPPGGMPTATDLPREKFMASAHPNPFNPITKIEFTMPQAGHLSLKVFNVRGELVRTLINEVTTDGQGFVMWDGENKQGKAVSSGVYFYEVRTEGEVKVNKLTLVR